MFNILKYYILIYLYIVCAFCFFKGLYHPVSVVAIRLQSSDVSEFEKKRFPKITSDVHDLKRGTGGRSSFNGKIATVFGASGFLGRSVINQLGMFFSFIPFKTLKVWGFFDSTLLYYSRVDVCDIVEVY